MIERNIVAGSVHGCRHHRRIQPPMLPPPPDLPREKGERGRREPLPPDPPATAVDVATILGSACVRRQPAATARGRGRRDGAERAAANEGGETGRRARPQPLVGERTPPPPLVGSGGRAPPQSLVRGEGAAAVAIRSRQRGGIGGREEMKFKIGINLNRPFNQTALASLALGRCTIGPPNWSASLG
uniref:Uncharacterized protein n=1 Tax=Oryza rufipogon TaxID=4529 RepID=A0A0E0RII0_ORYRU